MTSRLFNHASSLSLSLSTFTLFISFQLTEKQYTLLEFHFSIKLVRVLCKATFYEKLPSEGICFAYVNPRSGISSVRAWRTSANIPHSLARLLVMTVCRGFGVYLSGRIVPGMRIHVHSSTKPFYILTRFKNSFMITYKLRSQSVLLQSLRKGAPPFIFKFAKCDFSLGEKMYACVSLSSTVMKNNRSHIKSQVLAANSKISLELSLLSPKQHPVQLDSCLSIHYYVLKYDGSDRLSEYYKN